MQDWHLKKSSCYKAALMQKANEKLAVVKAAKDETLDWDKEFAKASSGAAELQAKADGGPSNETPLPPPPHCPPPPPNGLSRSKTGMVLL